MKICSPSYSTYNLKLNVVISKALSIKWNNPCKDKNINVFNQSLTDVSVDQKELDQAFSKLSKEVNPITANASCEEIVKLNVTEDGYFMIRVQYLNVTNSDKLFLLYWF